MNIAYAILALHEYSHLDPAFDFRVQDGVLRAWKNGLPQPTDEQVEQGWKLYQANEYKEQRAAEYPAIPDQLDAILKHLEAMGGYGGTDLETIIGQWRAVKLEFPKGGVAHGTDV